MGVIYGYNNGNHWPAVKRDGLETWEISWLLGWKSSPIMMLGRSIISRLIEKQNVHGTGAPFGFSNTQWDTTD